MEEVGLKISVGEFLLNTEFDNNDTHYTLHCYRVYSVSESTELSLSVHNDVRWVTREELSSLDFGPSDSVIRDYLLSL